MRVLLKVCSAVAEKTEHATRHTVQALARDRRCLSVTAFFPTGHRWDLGIFFTMVYCVMGVTPHRSKSAWHLRKGFTDPLDLM